MSEISDFEARITAALERIGRAVAVAEERAETAQTQVEGGVASDVLEAEVARLNDALAEEQSANAQLEARVKAIHDRQESHVAALEGEVETLRRQLMDHDREMQKLRNVNAQLRENNAALRAANAEGLGDASLIDEGMRAELEALKATRDVDVTELDALLTELRAVMTRSAAVPSSEEV
jgi:chromosome segregation ATPase